MFCRGVKQFVLTSKNEMQLPLTKGCLRNVDTLILPYKYFNLKISFLVLTPAFSSVQLSCSVMSDSAAPWTAARQASLSNTNSQNLLKLMSIESVMPSNRLILCRPLLLPSIFPSIRVSPPQIKPPEKTTLANSLTITSGETLTDSPLDQTLVRVLRPFFLTRP